jgi:hypothetical protein
MLELKSEYDKDEALLLAAAATDGEGVDAENVLNTLDRLFATEEYDGKNEYVISTVGTVPEQPGDARDRMWEWIGLHEKRLGIGIEVWGVSGEYLTPATVNGRVYGIDDFGRVDSDQYCVELELAQSLRALAEFHKAWRDFEASENSRPK